MHHITFIGHDGSKNEVEVPQGTSIMKAALSNEVSGIVGECGGQAMCATCHVYVSEEGLATLRPISEDEEELLECTASPRDEKRSRLGCQILAGTDFENIVVELPATQS